METQALPTGNRGESRLGQPGALRDELLLVGLVLFVFTAHAAASLALPNGGIWQTNPEDGFLLHLLVGLMGVALLYIPVLMVQALVTWDPSVLPQTESIACWLAAAAAVAVVATSFRTVPAWRRAFYAYLLAALLVEFAALHWSTLGN